MSSRSEEERAINDLGKRIRAVEDALRDSHKIYKDMVQELKRIRRATESDINVNITRGSGEGSAREGHPTTEGVRLP